jgi:hypothetical protein
MSIALMLLHGCASVIEDYEEARTLALTEPSFVPANWLPDASIQLSQPMIDTLITTALTPPPSLTSTLNAGVMSLTPALTVERLQLAASTDCTDCLQVDVDLGGTVGWAAPIVGTGSTSVRVGCRLDTRLVITPVEHGFRIGVVPNRIKDVHAEVGRLRTGVDLSGPIASWVQSGLIAVIPPFSLTEVGTDTAPVRGMRVSSTNQVVRVDLLTGARTPGFLPADLPAPRTGFSVDVALDSLLQIARADAFREPPMARGIVAEPTQLRFEPDHFLVRLRLWKTGRGFWRDYEVKGTYAMNGDDLLMSPTETKDKGHSPGAAFADPLVALTEGLVQRAVRKALDTAVPTNSGDLGYNTEVVLDTISGADGVLHATGSVRAISKPYGPQAPTP